MDIILQWKRKRIPRFTCSFTERGEESPFMSFFYTHDAPDYKEYKLKEGEFDAAKHEWHKENNTYGFSHGLGILIMSIGILTFLGIFWPKVGLVGAGLAIIMTLGTLSFLVTTPEVESSVSLY